MPYQRKRVGLLVLFILALIFAVAGQSHARTYLPGAKFGVNDDFFQGFDLQDDDAAMLAAANGGMGIVRIAVYWYQLQPFNPAVVGWDASLNEQANWPDHHLCVNGDVPFYCIQNSAAECQGNHAPAEADVRNFVSYTVNRLKGKVKYWGFANELTWWSRSTTKRARRPRPSS
jgi:hypothetical protein